MPKKTESKVELANKELGSLVCVLTTEYWILIISEDSFRQLHVLQLRKVSIVHDGLGVNQEIQDPFINLIVAMTRGYRIHRPVFPSGQGLQARSSQLRSRSPHAGQDGNNASVPKAL